MTVDISTDATADYIFSDESLIRLGLVVEKAMVEVRKGLLKSLLEDIKEIIDKKRGPSSDWITELTKNDQLMSKNAYLVIRKRDWGRVDNNWPCGAYIAAERANWNWVYMGVAMNWEQDNPRIDDLYQFCDDENVLGGCRKTPDQKAHLLWSYLEDFMGEKFTGNWSSSEFIDHIASENHRKEIAQKLADDLWVLASGLS